MRKKITLVILLIQLLSHMSIRAMLCTISLPEPHPSTLTQCSTLRGLNASIAAKMIFLQEKDNLAAVQALFPAHSLPTLEELLFWACKNGYVLIVQELLASNIDPNASCEHGWTPLLIATWNRHHSVVQELLAADEIDHNKALPNGVTPLYIAAAKGYPEIVKVLLAMDALNAMDVHGWTRLTKAAVNGNVEKIRSLLGSGEDVNGTTVYGFAPLHLTARKGNLDAVLVLLEDAAIDLEKALPTGETPLFCAVQEGQVEIVRALLNKNADPNNARNDGWTPLQTAVLHGDLLVVQVLLAATLIEVDKPIASGATALMLAAQYGHTEIARALLEKGADGSTPLIAAAQAGHAETINDGLTPLVIAIQAGSAEIVGLLVAAKVRVNEVSLYGWPPLKIAVNTG